MIGHAFQCRHETILVVLSYAVSVLGAYCSLQWATQIARATGKGRALWLAGSALAMGGGAIWSMHFIAMIACRLPVPVAYDPLTTLLSLGVAVAVSGAGLLFVSRGQESYPRLLCGGALTGLGVASMHYIGMAAMRLPARLIYTPWIVAVSVLIGIAAATAALWIAFHVGPGWARFGSALVMGLGVCGMHYTGMAAVEFVPLAAPRAAAEGVLGTDDLGRIVFAGSVAILALLIVGGWLIERRRKVEDLRRSRDELERQVAARTADLAQANQDLEAEITSRKRSWAERARLDAFTAAISSAFATRETMAEALADCAHALVNHLDAATASLWTLNERDEMLELRGCAGFGATVLQLPDRVAMGQHRVGRIAADRTPMLFDLDSGAAADDDKGRASEAGMVSFAGYPLILRQRVVGVLAMFADHRLTPATLEALRSGVGQIALGIGRVRAGEALAASEARARSIMDHMLDGLIIVDGKHCVRSVNPAGEALFGYAPGELVGKHLSLLIPETPGAATGEFFVAARERALGKPTEWEGKRKSGVVFPFELALFEFWTSEGRFFAGTVKDISERREVDRLKREFVSTVSHELRTPLTSIRGALSLVASGAAGPMPPQAGGLLDIALKNSERLTRLVNDILDLEKIESGHLEFRIEELELEPLLVAGIAANRSYADQYGVNLVLENDAPGARVSADADRLMQVMANLLSNAIKYSPRGADVCLRALRRNRNVRLEIVDRGPGIPEEFRSRIFSRFQQADSSDTRVKGGSGLGLAISRLIAEKLGGEIGFETKRGTGTTFWVDLPDIRALVEPSPGAPTERAPRPRILHVDDDPDLPKIVAAALSEHADVDIARSVREARQCLAGAAYDLVVIDAGLPDGSGLELQPLLDRPEDATPFILFTASEISRDAASAAAAVLVKSRSTVDELVGEVTRLIAQRPMEAAGKR